MTSEGVLQVLVSQAGGVYIPLWYKSTHEEASDVQSARPGEKVTVKLEPPSDGELGSETSSVGVGDKESSVTMSMSAEEGTSLEGDQAKEHAVFSSSTIPPQRVYVINTSSTVDVVTCLAHLKK